MGVSSLMLMGVAAAVTSGASSDWILMFKKGTPTAKQDEVIQLVQTSGGSIKARFNLLEGFAGTFDPSLAAELKLHPHVENVEIDGPVYAAKAEEHTDNEEAHSTHSTVHTSHSVHAMYAIEELGPQ